MTNYEKWKASKNFDVMQDEFQDLEAWGDCHCCPAYEQCQAHPYRLCMNYNELKKWAESEVEDNE